MIPQSKLQVLGPATDVKRGDYVARPCPVILSDEDRDKWEVLHVWRPPTEYRGKQYITGHYVGVAQAESFEWDADMWRKVAPVDHACPFWFAEELESWQQQEPALPQTDKPYQCRNCGAGFEEDELELNPVYECSNCGTIFTQEDAGGHQCPDCGKFAQRIGDYGCPDCGEGPVEEVTQ